MLVIALVLIVACGPLVLLMILGERFRRLGPLLRIATFALVMVWVVVVFIGYALGEDELLDRAVRSHLDGKGIRYSAISRGYDKDHSEMWSAKRYTVKLEDGGTMTLVVAGSDLWGPFDLTVKEAPAP